MAIPKQNRTGQHLKGRGYGAFTPKMFPASLLNEVDEFNQLVASDCLATLKRILSFQIPATLARLNLREQVLAQLHKRARLVWNLDGPAGNTTVNIAVMGALQKPESKCIPDCISTSQVVDAQALPSESTSDANKESINSQDQAGPK